MAHERVLLAVNVSVARILDLPPRRHRQPTDDAHQAVWVEEPLSDLGGVLVQLYWAVAPLAPGTVEAIEVPPAEQPLVVVGEASLSEKLCAFGALETARVVRPVPDGVDVGIPDALLALGAILLRAPLVM